MDEADTHFKKTVVQIEVSPDYLAENVFSCEREMTVHFDKAGQSVSIRLD